ncbi:hypothetical protein ZHAS_00005456 [Anopheles sinensis]|uniref:Uncharacterized protein n=1 Tax=Anopheles sinensis TaxID=74873 RepID=A0A084VJL6_ANOSI|nr:hypothetical protein ZHAS_00005456 [Anopheles sinensis]
MLSFAKVYAKPETRNQTDEMESSEAPTVRVRARLLAVYISCLTAHALMILYLRRGFNFPAHKRCSNDASPCIGERFAAECSGV